MPNPIDTVKKYAIIVAGGTGSRTSLPIPKQFVKLLDRPVLMHTIAKFAECFPDIEIIVPLPVSQIENWKRLCVDYNFTIVHTTIAGGDTRFQSVKNALNTIKEEGVVGIHDAARPLVSKQVILNSYKTAEMYGNAVPAIPMNESLRQIDSRRSVAVDRTRFCIVQTPQCFKIDLLKNAFEQGYNNAFTDDASVLEATGVKIHLIDGNPENIKITNPRDFLIAEALFKSTQSPLI
ncbi:MAG: 2-C-methyl-D-erythritol 4-phosphate cytidylyltransferase [Bacteroidetes bacterium]|nr:2-C-methyl-D-erythritol 4-phosphate cytidylyltransferase [Bacteroidota bacterium]